MNKIGKAIDRKNLGEALRLMKLFADEHKQFITGNLLARFDSIVGDYKLMRDFMQRGYRDEQRPILYRNLLRKAYRLTCDWHLKSLTARGSGAYWDAARNQTELLIPQETIRQQMEAFVQDLAVQGLELDAANSESTTQKLYNEHHQVMNRLFNALFVSPQWQQSDETFYTELILSPTIDILDARLLLSAITLSAMTEFDVRKASLLASVYRQASDESLRQRALVGLAFSMPTFETDLFPEYQSLIDQLLDDEQTRRELLELQLQVIYCMNADNDDLLIRKDIMPNIMKNQKFRITRDGIEEIDEDTLQDILHPDAEDKAMEELEESIRRMMDMQKSGADIYFGGFSQMKRFSFFYTLSHWFTPFYIQHPALTNVTEKLKGSRFLQVLLDSGPFCDSDKYSFALAMTTVVDHLPENMRDMLDNREAFGPTIDKSEQKSAGYLRRMYLQDLYRFFRLYNQKDDFAFCNPFDYDKNDNRFFFANPILSSEKLHDQKLTLGKFLLKRKEHGLLSLLLGSVSDRENLDYVMIEALLDMQLGDYEKAQQHFEHILAFTPDNERAMKGMAQSSFSVGDYAMAEHYYEELYKIHPKSVSNALNLSLAYIYHQRAEEAVSMLYELHYEYPDNDNVRRVLAWGLLWTRNLEQAEHQYQQLLAGEVKDPNDYLNAGYCQWFLGHVTEAVMLFSQFVATKEHADSTSIDAILSDEFRRDAALLEEYKTNDVDQKIMIDIVLEVARPLSDETIN